MTLLYVYGREMKLHHTVFGALGKEHAESIEKVGLIPHVADAYKDLVPEEIRHLPVVWLAEGIWQGWELPVFEVDTGDLDKEKLHPCAGFFDADKNLGWWVYQGGILPPVAKRVLVAI